MTSSTMTTCNRGDIVIVLYPFSDGSGTKPRPAVVVSADKLNTSLRDVIVAMITTQLSGSPSFCEFDLADWSALGLRNPSRVRLNRLASIEARNIKSCISQLGAADLTALNSNLTSALGL